MFDNSHILNVVSTKQTKNSLYSPAEFQLQQLSHLEKVVHCKATLKDKIKIVSGMLQILREKQQKQRAKFKQNLSTSFSDNCSNFTVYENQIDELEDRILQKRVIKFQVNQQIEFNQDDLFEVEKIVHTKRQYDESLQQKIQTKMKNIETEKIEHNYLDKSVSKLNNFVKNWFSK